ncbi:MAG: AMP-binding protein [Sphaerochaetaceae bacterium]|nr:AMP-binding protein [Sphaerochaetaceae bacterium]MDD4006588.1 AMP-binding protein [Sphaerochaetaceae bacterium]MDD4396517.1 AMP-binding protein [Sphaerochaetaceae bacterium]
MAKKKHNPIPWDFLANYKGEFFTGEWPTVPEMFNITVKRFPDRNCFLCFQPESVVYTYTEVQQIVLEIANFMAKKGIKHGDKVGLTGKNSPEWGFVYLAALYAGAVIVPIDHSLTVEEIERLMDFAEVKMAFADIDKLEKFSSSKAVQMYSLEKGSSFPYVLDCRETQAQDIVLPTSEEMAAILFTSGTTGNPKGVMLSHRNLVGDCYSAQSCMNIFETDVFYAILPIHHAYTMLAVFIEALSVGASIVFGKKLVVSAIFKEMKEAHVTMFLAVPMLYNKLLSGLMKGVKEKGPIVNGLIHFLMSVSGFCKKVLHFNPGKKMFGFLLKKVSLDSNRICISGGGPLPPSTFKQFNELGIDFVQGYGLTETSPIITLNPIFDYIETSVGRTVANTEFKVVDPDSSGNGLLYIKGVSVMMGYYKNPEATAEVLDKDGWLNTGDIGHIDSRKYVYLTGRAKNIIVTEGGKNVFPEEIEDSFQLYYDIEQLCCLGYTVDAKLKSEAVCALILPSDACRKSLGNDPEAVRKHMMDIVETVNRTLLPYQRIRKVIIVDEPFELSSTNKVKRFKVAEKYKDQING